MKKEVLISVVIPVYNCQSYLEECVKSVCAQTYKKMEIILVDDGSTDESGSLCDRMSEADERIKVIHKENGGQQDARVAGIFCTKGEYIGFVDADDWIEPDMYETLYSNLNDADICSSGINVYGKDGEINEVWYDRYPEGKYSCTESYFLDRLIRWDNYQEDEMIIGGITNNVVNKLFKREVVLKVAELSNQGIWGEEDWLFTLLTILESKEISIIKRSLYNYRYNESSVIHTKKGGAFSERLRLYEQVDCAITNSLHKDELRKQLQLRMVPSILRNLVEQLDMVEELRITTFVFPRMETIIGKKVVLFGAGNVGEDYALCFLRNKDIELVDWVDSGCIGKEKIVGTKKFIIDNPANIQMIEFDYVIIAVKYDAVKKEILKSLLKLGIDESKILTDVPENRWDSIMK